MRLALAIVAALGLVVTMPAAAGALQTGTTSWAAAAFVVIALVAAGSWWLHMRDRRRRIGVSGAMAGWLLIGSLALLGLSGSLWLLVGMAVLASALTYGVVLLVTQSRAPNPRRELATGLALFATAGATALFVLTTGLADIDTWWVPAHWALAIGLGIATVAGGVADSGERE